MISWSCISKRTGLFYLCCIGWAMLLTLSYRAGAETGSASIAKLAGEATTGFAQDSIAGADTRANAGIKGLFWHAQFDEGHAWLLGSVHFANSRFYPLASQITDAFEQSEVLLVEMDEQTVSTKQQQEVILSMAMYPAGETIQQHVSAKTLKLISSEMQKLGMSLPAIERFRPGFLMMTAAAMQSMQLGYTPDYGIDHYFLSKARDNKKILQIESFQEQIALLGSIPGNDEAIYNTFARMPENGKLWQAMEDAWQAGDAEAVYKLAIADPLQESPESIDFYDALFFQRNLKMADAVESCVAEHFQCFVIVGAGHLVGPESVVELLKKQGARVRFM